MGTYTTNLRLYKPAANEFVDPQVHLNDNFNTIDKALKRLMEYEYTNLDVPDIVNSVDRARFYKSYSNSVMTYFRSGNFFYQDPTAFVSTWTPAKSLLQLGWIEHPDFPLHYRIVRKAASPTTAEVEWTGAICNNDHVTIDVNTNMFIIDTGIMPALIRPVASKYFTVNAGNTAANYSIARLFFSSAGSVEMKRYGADPTNPSDENRIEFTGVRYNIEVPA